tara:strand:- start:341 stop:3250 length:2910 start_codon:yes stop_codon:yes gene_type:complete
MSKIVIAAGAMPFGPDTLKYTSLGGSETAALQLGKSLAERGHTVVMFCNLPEQGRPDYFEPFKKHLDGVTYCPINAFGDYTTGNLHDLLIAVRDPSFVNGNVQAKKKVLWMHDIATKRTMQRALESIGWTFDEIWTVSEWHRQQVHEVTGYKLDNIVAFRNGVVRVSDLSALLPISKQLVYASRPERGLQNLIKEGGIMERLPDYNLIVAMYEHFPEHMRPFYEYVYDRMGKLPNVTFVGGKTQEELRAIIKESEAYIYPTQFEETSCILARECIEQGTPFITTKTSGALPETLGDCGIYFEDWLVDAETKEAKVSSDEWCQQFADFFQHEINSFKDIEIVRQLMSKRTDLYWDGVAELVEDNMEPRPVKTFSYIWSLIRDGDVMAARAMMDDYLNKIDAPSAPIASLAKELALYDFIDGDMQEYYEKVYKDKEGTEKNELKFTFEFSNGTRFKMIADEVRKLPPGAKVVEYGCGSGHVLAPLAKEFPNIQFYGFDYSESCAKLITGGAEEHGIDNLKAGSDWDSIKNDPFFPVDLAICTEVLEHNARPWEILQQVESLVRKGGQVIATVPFGAWEPNSYDHKGQWEERQHLWEIDATMFREMCGTKEGEKFFNMVGASDEFGRIVGNLFYLYVADHNPIVAVSALEKAKRHYPRQTCAAAIIAYNNEDTILRTLNSLDYKVQFVQIAHGPSTDKTLELVTDWLEVRPWIRYNIIDVPKIEAYKFGFDDARNKSAENLEDFDWFLWIDTDEYLSGNPQKYLRWNYLDGYLTAQHHFSCVPRGNPAEIDRPARLVRTTSGFKAIGHIHEHFETPEGGPGACFMPEDLDIGHPGYVNEEVRQKRFHRNFPFLEWDHEDPNPRKLHHFLWFRDIIHRMRFEGNNRELALEAVRYYNEYKKEMSAFGPGLFQALKYLSEAYQVLQIGVPIQAIIKLDDRSADFSGVFENYEQFSEVVGTMLKEEFKDRTSKYW